MATGTLWDLLSTSCETHKEPVVKIQKEAPLENLYSYNSNSIPKKIQNKF